MLYRLVQPMRRAGSRHHQFVKRIPVDLMGRLGGRRLRVPLGDGAVELTISPKADSIRFSLRTSDPVEVRLRQAEALATVEAFFRAVREDKPVALTGRQIAALSGEIYRAWSADRDAGRSITVEEVDGRMVLSKPDPEEEIEGARAFHARLIALEEAGTDEAEEERRRLVDPLIDRVLVNHGIAGVDEPSREGLRRAFLSALKDAFEVRPKRLDHDFTPDPNAARFPDWQPPEAKEVPASHPTGGSLMGLVEDWWREAKAAGKKPSTYESYRNTMAAFVAYLKHDDAARVRPKDVIGFKDHRLQSVNPRTGKPISAKTVKDSDLAGLKTVFGWAKANLRTATNPAEGVTLKVAKPARLRERGLTDDEAQAILKAAAKFVRGNEQPETAAAKRWVPWLLAYSGARVGEIAQLRKEDIRREGDLWVLRITPEAGTVKTNQFRELVIHPHVIEQGFGRFVEAAKAGHLFVRVGKNGDVSGPLQGVKNRLSEMARAIVTDPNVQPNHGWRHRFKTVGLEAGIEHRILDAIQGHAPKTQGESYGDVTLKTKAAAILKLPRYEVG